MKYFYAALLLIATAGRAQDSVSAKKLPPIALSNRIVFNEAENEPPRFGCGFLLKYQNDTFAVTAKHLLKIIHPPQMTTLTLEPFVKSWTMFAPDQPGEQVTTYKLINENNKASLSNAAIYEHDFLVFSIAHNTTRVKPLEPRTTPLVEGEKLYVAGWTRTMVQGAQRVYEFAYYKTIGQRILLKEIIAPALMGGLSGAPVVDEQGLLVGIVSNSTVDPATGKKYFSPCTLESLLDALKTDKKE